MRSAVIGSTAEARQNWVRPGEQPDPAAEQRGHERQPVIQQRGSTTPVRITDDGVERAGQPRRLVMPDGLEIHGRRRLFCRGRSLHLHHDAWYLLDLDEVFA